jgi:predicted small metal-binding protein
MRAVLCASLCNCRHSLRADDDEELVGKVRDHLRRHHPAVSVREQRIREIVSTHAYDLEYAEVNAGGTEPEEEFGPEPY